MIHYRLVLHIKTYKNTRFFNLLIKKKASIYVGLYVKDQSIMDHNTLLVYTVTV